MMKGVVGPMSIREEALRSDLATEVGPASVLTESQNVVDGKE